MRIESGGGHAVRRGNPDAIAGSGSGCGDCDDTQSGRHRRRAPSRSARRLHCCLCGGSRHRVEHISPVVGHHAYFVDGTTVKAVASDGSVASVGTLMLPSRSSMYSLAVGIAISPDESEIAYGYAVGVKASASGAAVSTYASRVFVERVGGSPHQLIDAPADANGFLLPFAWSTRGLWVTHTPIGLGGAGPFLNYQALNPSLVNPTTGAVGQMQSSCRFPNATSVRPTGASACIVVELTTPRTVTVA